jgi:polar amino acid transport system substrate-binding protein
MVADHKLVVGAAFPDPPFDVPGSPPRGFDIELTQRIARELGLEWRLFRYDGEDFDGIFAALTDGRCNLVASGATVTPHRQRLARFCSPYLQSGQSLVVNPTLRPEAVSVDHLAGLALGVQHGNTSEPVARRLHAAGRIAEVKVYAYDQIAKALDDVESGAIAAFMKLEPVLRHLTSDRPKLRIVQTGITTELLAVAVAPGDIELQHAVDEAQVRLHDRGDLRDLRVRWFATSDPAATKVLL